MTKKRKIALLLTWGFTAVCMIIIFYYSHQVASVSSETSSGWIDRLFEMFNIELTSHVIRKTAHAIEFGGLCFAFNLAYSSSYLRFCPFVSIVSTVLYATTDEIHQYFIDGRACQVRDVFVDFCGALLVTIGLSIIYLIYLLKVKNKREV